jgi:hypothetical protein
MVRVSATIQTTEKPLCGMIYICINGWITLVNTATFHQAVCAASLHKTPFYPHSNKTYEEGLVVSIFTTHSQYVADASRQDRRRPILAAGKRIKINIAQKTVLSGCFSFHLILPYGHLCLDLPVMPHSEGRKDCIINIHRVMVRHTHSIA